MPKSRTKTPPVVFTVGHSTRTLDSFIDLLRERGVKRLVDIRTVPRSRHNPQFNKETLPQALASAGIKYTHMPDLGGLRRPRRHSANPGWRNASFRGFADYMQTEEFGSGMQKLMALAERQEIVLMCAEAVPWRCHRSLIADALLVRGVKVHHIMSGHACKEHSLTPWAKVKGKSITYPPDTLSMDFESGKERS